MASDDFDAARLLSGRNDISVLEEEAVLRNVLRLTVETPPRWWSLRRRIIGLSAAAATFAVFLVALLPDSEPDAFTARGTAALRDLEVGCNGRATCGVGDVLVFRLVPARSDHFFAAFAKSPDGSVFWYFPGQSSSTSVAIENSTPEGIVRQGVSLGDEYVPGVYEIYGFFSERPLSRADIKQFVDSGRATDSSVRLVKKRFQVQVQGQGQGQGQ